MNDKLTHFSTYVGFYLSLLLALTCNLFLDIKYGSFSAETVFWALIFGYSLKTGWRHRVGDPAPGKRRHWIFFYLGITLFISVFLPKWGMPRAAIYLMAMLQVAQNCISVSRRQLYLGLLLSLVWVMFAATHYRADWTMLFYLLPYFIAVVFTVVSEQIHRQTELISLQSLNAQGATQQWPAIAAATMMILLLALVFYLITPQFSYTQVNNPFGVNTNIASDQGESGQMPANQSGTADEPSQSGQGGRGAGAGGQTEGRGQGLFSGYGSREHGGMPSPEMMRKAAERKGMPKWQQSAIRHLADGVEKAQTVMRRSIELWQQLMQTIQDFFQHYFGKFLFSLILLILLALLAALWFLIKETRVGLVVLIYSDRLRLGYFGLHASGRAGARQYYRAIERLFDYEGVKRRQTLNTQEYLQQLLYARGYLRNETTEITHLFEQARYGKAAITDSSLNKMKGLYLAVYRNIVSTINFREPQNHPEIFLQSTAQAKAI